MQKRRYTQSDLFSQPLWLETVMRKLPPCDYLSTSDVALAFGVSSTKVTQWIEEGRLEAADLNTGTNLKTFWKIPRCSAIALAQSIAHGV